MIGVATIAACLGPSLSSTEQTAIVVQPGTTISLGSIDVGATGSATLTISPASGSQSTSDTITMIAMGTCPGWAVNAPGLPATVEHICSGSGSTAPNLTSDAETASCTDTFYNFEISYTPSGAGSSSCSYTIMGMGTTFSPVTVMASASGVAQAFAMDVQPKSINFGDVNVGTTGSQTLSIQNTGANSLTITGIAINPMPPYSVTAVGSAIPPSGTQNATVTCAPTTMGTFNSTLVVSGSGVDSQSVSLACKGIVSDLSIAPSPVDMTTRVGDMITRDVIVQTGGTGTTFNSITVNPTVANIPVTIVSAPLPGTSLGSGSSATIKLRFAPTQAQAPTQLAQLRINHDGNITRDVVINGAALQTTIAVFPDTVDFGAVCAGTTEMKDVEVKAATAGSFTLSSITAPAAPFSFAPTSGTSLPAQALGNGGNTLRFVASVAPVSGTSMVTSQATLNTDIPGKAAHQVTLKAEVLPGGIGASPSGIDFGGLLKSTVSSAMSTVIRNCSDSPLTIDAVQIEGPNGNEFSIVLPPPAERLVTLQPRESIEYAVIANPMTPGAKVGTLAVVSGASSTKVALQATALGAGGTDGTDERSYYTCGVGSAGGAGLFGLLVVLGLRLRRRRT